ncbi:endonuclease/exonuclease/phosphatase family protein [Microbacteriaceae bacterium]|nr:endonuclease/exonuclease/phosphatase family protein [Candidatus Saccharibacteria bacterium]
MPEIRVVSWNAEGMFVEGTKTRRAKPTDAISVLKQLNADIVVIPEFGRKDGIAPQTIEAIAGLSYEYAISDYNDERMPALSFAILSKLPIVSQHTFGLAGSARQALQVECRLSDGQLISVIGVHLDDRSESMRKQQITSVVEAVRRVKGQPILVMGDFNAMSVDSRFAQFARSLPVRMLTKLILHKQLHSVVERVSEMALGTTINHLLHQTALQNLDPKLQRTISAKQAGMEWMPSWRIGKIDWIFGTVPIKVRSYAVMRDVGSDHRPVVADITITPGDNNRA